MTQGASGADAVRRGAEDAEMSGRVRRVAAGSPPRSQRYGGFSSHALAYHPADHRYFTKVAQHTGLAAPSPVQPGVSPITGLAGKQFRATPRADALPPLSQRPFPQRERPPDREHTERLSNTAESGTGSDPKSRTDTEDRTPRPGAPTHSDTAPAAISQAARPAAIQPPPADQSTPRREKVVTAGGRQVVPRPSLSPAVSKSPALKATDIDAPHGTKSALDSCKVPLDLSSLRANEDSIRIELFNKLKRSARGAGNAQRGEQLDPDSRRPVNSRAHDSTTDIFVCNSGRLDEHDLVFTSQFESGNLLSAQKVGPQDYDLQLQVDRATSGHTQWFFFCVSNTSAGVQYRFNITNLAKPDSLYLRGQQPLFFSLAASQKEKEGWRRIGRDIRYFRNGRKRNGKALFTLSFLVEFAHTKDKCLFAHCYPYTHTELQDYLGKMKRHPIGRECVSSDVLCTTLDGNECSVLTITSPSGTDEDKIQRKAVFLSARVHPGESNSSWIMKGFLDFLLGPSQPAQLLRNTYIFKIVPMLNPDGVIHGHYRCNLAGYDLNRVWHDPISTIHPTIYSAKELLKTLQLEREVIMFCDIHGHSVKHNLFLYGTPQPENTRSSSAESASDDDLPDFPNTMDNVSSFFSMPDSLFVIEKIKENTGRVVAWRELGISNSFTLEASLCGSGIARNECTAQFTCTDFETMGREFGVSLALWTSPDLSQRVAYDPQLLQEMLLPCDPGLSEIPDLGSTHVTDDHGENGTAGEAESRTDESRKSCVRGSGANQRPRQVDPTSPLSLQLEKATSPTVSSGVAARQHLEHQHYTRLLQCRPTSPRASPRGSAKSITLRATSSGSNCNGAPSGYQVQTRASQSHSPLTRQRSTNAPVQSDHSDEMSSSDDERQEGHGAVSSCNQTFLDETLRITQIHDSKSAETILPANAVAERKQRGKGASNYGLMTRSPRKETIWLRPQLDARIAPMLTPREGDKFEAYLVGNLKTNMLNTGSAGTCNQAPPPQHHEQRFFAGRPPPDDQIPAISFTQTTFARADSYIAANAAQRKPQAGTSSADEEFAPLSRRHRLTSQRLQVKTLQGRISAANNGYAWGNACPGQPQNPNQRPPGPHTKFLPIMLGTLGNAYSSSAYN